MLGAVGFLVMVITVGIYAYTSFTNYKLVPLREKQLFVSAYSILSLAALVWMVVFFVGDARVPQLVFMGDVMLVAASLCALGIVVNLSKPLNITIATLVVATLLTLRAFILPSEAYVSDGLLHFNLSQLESLIFGLMFLIVWLPATIKVVYMAFHSPALVQFRGPVSYLFISTVLMTSFFLSAKRPIMIIISFISILLFFALLTAVNIGMSKVKVEKLKEVPHG